MWCGAVLASFPQAGWRGARQHLEHWGMSSLSTQLRSVTDFGDYTECAASVIREPSSSRARLALEHDESWRDGGGSRAGI